MLVYEKKSNLVHEIHERNRRKKARRQGAITRKDDYEDAVASRDEKKLAMRKNTGGPSTPHRQSEEKKENSGTRKGTRFDTLGGRHQRGLRQH